MTDTALAPPAAVTVIGLGNMGIPMAACLLKAGFEVTGYDRAAEARSSFAAVNGRSADELATAVSSAEVVILLLPDGKIVREVVTEAVSHLRRGTLIVDMGSSDPIGTRDLGAQLIAAGFEFVDAPVSGGVKRAVNGTLAIMAGGTPASIDRLEPLFAAMGSSVFRTGPLGSGHAMKALNNYVSAAGLVAAVEALRIGQGFGLDPVLMTDILNESTGRNNATDVKLKQFVISRSFNSGFPLRLMAKDVRTAANIAHALGVASPFVASCARLWESAAQNLDLGADHTEIIKYLEAGA